MARKTFKKKRSFAKRTMKVGGKYHKKKDTRSLRRRSLRGKRDHRVRGRNI